MFARRFLPLVLLPAIGCAQLFGLDPTGRADASDTDPLNAVFQAEAYYFGAQVRGAPLELNDSILKAWVADPAASGGFRRIPVKIAGTTATCEVPSGTEGLWEVTMPPPFDPVLRVFPITDQTRVWNAVIGVDGNQVITPPPADAALDISTTLSSPYVPGDTLSLFVTGAWSYAGFGVVPEPNATLFDPPPLPYTQLVSAGLPQVPAVTPEDRVYVIRHRGAFAPDSIRTIVGATLMNPFALMPGNNALNGAEVAVTNNRSLNATFAVDDVVNRLQFQLAQGATLVHNYWHVEATPATEYPFSRGPSLVGTLASASISANYGNPFSGDGLASVLTWVAQTQRQEPEPGGGSWTHFAGFTLIDKEPESGDQYTPDVGIVTTLKLNGVPLTSDRLPVAIGLGQAFEFTFELDRSTASHRHLDCYRFDPGFRYSSVISTKVVGDRVRIHPSMLPRGPRYMCRLHSFTGTRQGAQGDERNPEKVVSISYADSHSFTIP